MSASGGPVCIIGGTGFLGSALRRRLLADGHELVVVGRAKEVAVRPGETYVPAADLGRLSASRSQGTISAIVDLAYGTVPSTSFDDPVADFSANLGSVISHLELARHLGVDRYLFVSSGGTVYGDQGQTPIPEDAPNAPISPYGITKLASEHYARLYRQVHGVPALILRPSNIYGPGQPPFRGQGLISTAFAAALRGEPVTIYGDGSNVRDYLYVEDFCTGLIAALATGEIGATYNVGSGTGTSVRGLIERIGPIVARDGYRVAMDWRESRPFDVQCNILDSSKLATGTGWEPKVPLEAGLEATWHWIKTQ